MIILLFVLSIISPVAGTIYLLVIIISTLVKAVGIAVRTIQGDRILKRAMRLDWAKRLNDLGNAHDAYDRLAGSSSESYGFEQHLKNLRMIAVAEPGYYPKPSEIYHAAIITMYNESSDVLIPTIESIRDTTFPNKRIILVLAYEERGGEEAEKTAKALEKKFSKTFKDFLLIKHPDGIKNEVIGKGGNITNAGRALQAYIENKKMRYGDVIVTTLDSDNRPHAVYFDQVAYEYIVHNDRKRLSYQPVSLFMSNIWDAPAPMRIIAVGNSFWNIICSMRPHALRNFASHSQPLDALVEMDFWSTRTIVEDGHQYWRSLFHFDGNYEVLPIRAPIYQDAVLSNTMWKTLKAQFIQLRRWDYGASDVAYVGTIMLSKKRPMKFWDLFPKFLRLIDGHVTLAAVAPIVAFGGWVPLITNYQSRSLLAYHLPNIVSVIQLVASVGLFITIFLSLSMLPKRPARYRKSKKFVMLIQWVLMPVVSIVYSSFAAFYSQTRLMLGRYMEKFDVTDKAVKK
ncbi:MAG: glycosyltransferase family 2 protein [Candidatus Nomurabacteria bacterium]|nr:glycosyltransferase family 2 protein [Candidatus Nomurabacteria bacterium]